MSRSPARIFVDADLGGDRLPVDERTAHYVGHVLRLGPGDEVVAFDGRGVERLARIDRLTRRASSLTLHERLEPLPGPALEITLLQGLIKPDRMDLVVQKATELGVARIVAVRNEYCAIKLTAERIDAKLAHWRRVAASACEQSGRHYLPEILHARSLADAVAARPATEPRLALHNGPLTAGVAAPSTAATISVVVGPEGGFSQAELDFLAADTGVAFVRLGERVLRAETAAIVACTLAQLKWGDFS